MADLTTIRKKIDHLNSQLCQLLNERFQIMTEVARAKQLSGTPVYDPVREQQIMTEITRLAQPEYASEIRLVFSLLLALGKNRQRLQSGTTHPLVRDITANVQSTPFPRQAEAACAGGPESLAAAEHFFPGKTVRRLDHTESLLTAIAKGKYEYGILPSETPDGDRTMSLYRSLAGHQLYISGAWRPRPDTGHYPCRYFRISRQPEIFPGATHLSLLLTLSAGSVSFFQLLSGFAAKEIPLTKIVFSSPPGSGDQMPVALDFRIISPREKVFTLLNELISDPGFTDFTFLGTYREE